MIGIRSRTLIGYNINSHVSEKNAQICKTFKNISETLKVIKLQISGRLFHIGFENVADEGTFRKGGLGGLGGAIFSLSFFFGRGGGLKIASFD